MQIQGWLLGLAEVHYVLLSFLAAFLPTPEAAAPPSFSSSVWGSPETPLSSAAVPSALLSPLSSPGYGCLPSQISGMIQLRE